VSIFVELAYRWARLEEKKSYLAQLVDHGMGNRRAVKGTRSTSKLIQDNLIWQGLALAGKSIYSKKQKKRTSDFDVAHLRMVAVSLNSTKKVDCFSKILSEAPMRVKMRSVDDKDIFSAGT